MIYINHLFFNNLLMIKFNLCFIFKFVMALKKKLKNLSKYSKKQTNFLQYNKDRQKKNKRTFIASQAAR